jgi:hypothetical protein
MVCQFTKTRTTDMTLNYKKVSKLWYPTCKAKVIITYNPKNSALAKALNRVSEDVYDIQEIEQRGVLIGDKGHLQLIEWKYVKSVIF